MKTTIDAGGRLVIPKAVHGGAALMTGMLLEMRCRAGRIEIGPAPLPVKLVRKGRLVAAVGPLTAGMAEHPRQALRQERASSA